MDLLRLLLSRSSGWFGNLPGSPSKPLYSIAYAAVSLSLSVMLVSTFVMRGFDENVTIRITGLTSGIQILPYGSGFSLDSEPFEPAPRLMEAVRSDPGCASISQFAVKPALLKSDQSLTGIFFKGVDSLYAWDAIEPFLVEGRFPTAKNELFLSRKTAQRLNLKVGDRLLVYFAQKPARVRKLSICGLYHSGLEELDDRFAYGSFQLLASLAGWRPGETGGLEVRVKPGVNLMQLKEKINSLAGVESEAKTVDELYPQLFDWLSLQKLNLAVILILMGVVAAINMLTAFLIMIMEETRVIGILKTMGMQGKSLRRYYLIKSSRLAFRGILIGNLISLVLILSQQYLGWAKLDERTYYMDTVPLSVDAISWIIINAGVFLVCVISMLLPAMLIGKISPLKAIRLN